MALALALALGIEGMLAWPAALHRRIGHPVGWIGRLIGSLDRAWNRPSDPPAARRRAGALAVLLVIGLSAGLAGAIAAILPVGVAGLAATAVLAAPFLAGRSLHDHVAAVAAPLADADMDGARRAVSAIVGRDPATLDAAGIARAAIESLAENASDGVVAPVFWGLILGLPGLVGYKAINTLDSMIGYRTERHLDFGAFAARLDDVANWVPARLTGAMIALVSGRPGRVLSVMRADAPHHRSPNAGWPEAAMAAAIGCRLSGPRTYATGAEPAAWLNGAAPDPDAGAIRRALSVFVRAMALLGAGLLALSLA